MPSGVAEGLEHLGPDFGVAALVFVQAVGADFEEKAGSWHGAAPLGALGWSLRWWGGESGWWGLAGVGKTDWSLRLRPSAERRAFQARLLWPG